MPAAPIAPSARPAGAATQRRERRRGRPGGADPQRPPVGAVGRLGLDPRFGAELAEARDQPLGGPALAVGGGGAVDPLQFLEPLAQPIPVRRHEPGKLPTYHGHARRRLLHPLPCSRDQDRGRLVLVPRPLLRDPLTRRTSTATARRRGRPTPFLLAVASASVSSARSSCTSSATPSSRCATGSGSPASSSGSSAAWRGWTANPRPRARTQGRARRPAGDAGDRPRPHRVGIAAAGGRRSGRRVLEPAPASPA